jgi:hypothetical protein
VAVRVERRKVDGGLCETALFEAVAERSSIDDLISRIESAPIPDDGRDVREGWWRRDAPDAIVPQRFPSAILASMMCGVSRSAA